MINVGRRPSTKKGTKPLRGYILDWMKVKGISSRGGLTTEQAAAAIATVIHKRGWKSKPAPYGAINYSKFIDNALPNALKELNNYYMDLAKEEFKKQRKK